MKRILIFVLLLFAIGSCSKSYYSRMFFYNDDSQFRIDENLIYVYTHNMSYSPGYLQYYIVQGNTFKEVSSFKNGERQERVFAIRPLNDTLFLYPLFEVFYTQDSYQINTQTEATNQHDFIIIEGTSLTIRRPSNPLFSTETTHLINYNRIRNMLECITPCKTIKLKVKEESVGVPKIEDLKIR